MYLRSLAVEPPGFPRLDQASNPPLWWPLGTVPYLAGRALHGVPRRSGAGAEAIARVPRPAGRADLALRAELGGRAASSGRASRSSGTSSRSHEEARAREELAADPRAAGDLAHRASPSRAGGPAGRAGRPTAPPSRTCAPGLDEFPGRPADHARREGCRARASAAAGRRRASPSAAGWPSSPAARSGASTASTTTSGSSTSPPAAAGASPTAPAPAEPALSADGAWLAYVRRTGPGETALVRRRLEGGAEESLFAQAGRPGVRAGACRPTAAGSPSRCRRPAGGTSPLLDGDRLVRVTDDAAIDAEPDLHARRRAGCSSPRIAAASTTSTPGRWGRAWPARPAAPSGRSRTSRPARSSPRSRPTAAPSPS